MPRGTALFIFSWLALLIFTLSHTPHRRVRGGGGRCAGCGLCLFNAIHSPCPQHITPSPPPKTLTAPKTHTHAPSRALSLSLSAGSVKHSPCLASINHRFSLGIVTAGCTDIDEMSTLTTTCASLYLYLYLSDLNCLKEFMICNNDLGLLGCTGFTEKMAQLYITAGWWCRDLTGTSQGPLTAKEKKTCSTSDPSALHCGLLKSLQM